MEIRTETTTTPPPPPPPKPKPLSFTNGVLKKHPIYRECLKNHAASLGGHALDGCGEFMPSPTSSPADPTSLKCAACGCHRNFHRREPHHHQHHHHHHHEDMGPNSKSPSTPPYFPSAPQMLLALSTGVAGHDDDDRTVTRKRFRTKFSKDQKEKMLAFSERLGWKMQKKDEGMIEEFCNEVGVGKGVFKVWMHNNKHNLKRGELNNNNVDDQTNNNETHLMNGSSSSS